MPTVNPTDVAFLLCIAGVAAFPWLLSVGKAALSRINAVSTAVVTKEPSQAARPENWVDVLLEMKADLEQSGNNADAVKLVRQLIWQLIGGGPTP